MGAIRDFQREAGLTSPDMSSSSPVPAPPVNLLNVGEGNTGAEEVAEEAALRPWYHCWFPFKRHGKLHVMSGKKADVGMHTLREDAALGAARSGEAELPTFRIHAPIEISK